MTEERCPFCETALINLKRIVVPDTTSLYCKTCKLELVQYPSTNKKGIQHTGLHALIPLANFLKSTWQEFLFTERNFYGERTPDRMPFFSSPEEKEMVQAERKQIAEEKREWEERVG